MGKLQKLQTCRHLHLVDCRYGIILTVDIKVENPLVEVYGAFGTHRWQGRAFARYGEIDNEMKCELVKLID